MNEKIELMPCPFCGGKAQLLAIDEREDEWAVECPTCDSMVGFSMNVQDGGWRGCGREDTISRWNKRAEETERAMRKQRKEKPDYEGDGYVDGESVIDTWICPNCGTHYELDLDEYEYCPKCGQHIDWDGEEGES